MAKLDNFKKIYNGGNEINKVLHQGKTIWERIYTAKDSDFVKVNAFWVYRGSELEVKVPHVIQGERVTSYNSMFRGSSPYSASPVTRVVSDIPNVTDTAWMFSYSQATTLDLSSFNASNIITTGAMFYNSQTTTGYARTQADADKFNASSYKPAGLNFVVKP